MTNNKINKLKNIIQLYTNTENMTNNKLAVEWLWEIAYNRELTVEDWKQAKEIEKDQHIKSWETGLMKVDFNEYYNETYGGGDK